MQFLHQTNIPFKQSGNGSIKSKCLRGLLCLAIHSATLAQENHTKTKPETAQELREFTVTAQKNTVETPPLTTQYLIKRDELRTINVINPEDSLQYSPNLFIRKRFTGDRNGVLSIRGASPFQNARSLVFADGVLLSNLLENRWNGAPKWQVVASGEIESVEVLYGPYSAEYSGNAMNGVVQMKTRQPPDREATIQGTYFTQSYSDRGVDDTFDGYKGFISYGDKTGKLSYYGFFQRLENDSHPQSLASSTGLRTPDGSETEVSGPLIDRDRENRERFIYGARSFIETRQNLGKTKFAYDFSERMRMQLTLALWDTTDETNRSENFLRDSAGNPVWDGEVRFDGRSFTVSPSNFRVESRRRQDLLSGLTIEGTTDGDLDYEILFTYYGILNDEQRQSLRNPSDPAFTGAGRVQDMDGVFWLSSNVKIGREEWLGNPDLSGFAGYHFNHYDFNLTEWNSSSFATGARDDSIRNRQSGETRQQALFSQWEWEFTPQWTVAGGLRAEYWQARDGTDFTGGSPISHPGREEFDLSPKFSIEYTQGSEWNFRLSLARAVRYPIVTELFQGDPDERARVVNNPELEAEKVLAGSLMAERRFNSGAVAKVAVFHHRETDTIFSQSAELDDGSTLNTFVNIDKVIAQGVELSWSHRGMLDPALDVDFNVSYNDARIEENGVNPSIEGSDLPRVPRWRINLLNTWRPTERLNISAGLRYASKSFNNLDNSDTNQNTFGGISGFMVINLKTRYEFDNGLSLSAGIDNLNDDKFWMAHPFPQRTLILDAVWRF